MADLVVDIADSRVDGIPTRDRQTQTQTLAPGHR